MYYVVFYYHYIEVIIDFFRGYEMGLIDFNVTLIWLS